MKKKSRLYNIIEYTKKKNDGDDFIKENFSTVFLRTVKKLPS